MPCLGETKRRRRSGDQRDRPPSQSGLSKTSAQVSKVLNTGTTLRLTGKGVPKRGGGHGDELVKLKVMVPSEPDPELETFLSGWTPGSSYDPRREMQS